MNDELTPEEISEMRAQAAIDQMTAFGRDASELMNSISGAIVNVGVVLVQRMRDPIADINYSVRKTMDLIDPHWRQPYRQTKRGRVPRLDPLTRAQQQIIRERSGRR